MTSKVVNVTKNLKLSTDMRVSPEVVEEVAERLRIEIVPMIARSLEKRARSDSPPRRTIQAKDLAVFDFLDWWRLLEREYND